jgi:hypothetical protein
LEEEVLRGERFICLAVVTESRQKDERIMILSIKLSIDECEIKIIRTK